MGRLTSLLTIVTLFTLLNAVSATAGTHRMQKRHSPYLARAVGDASGTESAAGGTGGTSGVETSQTGPTTSQTTTATSTQTTQSTTQTTSNTPTTQSTSETSVSTTTSASSSITTSATTSLTPTSTSLASATSVSTATGATVLTVPPNTGSVVRGTVISYSATKVSSTTDEPTGVPTPGPAQSFFANTPAVIGVFTAVGVLVLGALACLAVTLIKNYRRRQTEKEEEEEDFVIGRDSAMILDRGNTSMRSVTVDSHAGPVITDRATGFAMIHPDTTSITRTASYDPYNNNPFEDRHGPASIVPPSVAIAAAQGAYRVPVSNHQEEYYDPRGQHHGHQAQYPRQNEYYQHDQQGPFQDQYQIGQYQPQQGYSQPPDPRYAPQERYVADDESVYSGVSIQPPTNTTNPTARYPNMPPPKITVTSTHSAMEDQQDYYYEQRGHGPLRVAN